MNRFDAVSPLDYRYYGDPRFFGRLRPYVSESAYIAYLLRVELNLVRMLAKWGVCPASVPREVEKACAEITAEEVYAEEDRVHHNIRALVNCIKKRISEDARPFVHLFATSVDIMDTAAALRYKELFRDIILPDLFELEEVLIDMARSNAEQIQMGRTHGQHAVPMTFGFALALYVSRIGSRIDAIFRAHRNLRGKFSGAVGAFNAISLLSSTDPTHYEIEFLAELGLKPSDTSISSQIVEQEFVTDLAYAVTSCFSVLGNLADDIRNLMRTEIGELIDRYDDQEVGSSTMPHKVNPKNFENIKSFWKLFAPRLNTVIMDQISEHQRDLTNSASGRFLMESFVGFDYAVKRTISALQKVEVNRARMKENVDQTKQKIVAEPLYIVLALQGCPNAYELVMTLSRESQRTGAPLVELVRQHPELSPYFERLSAEHKRILADPSLYLGDAVERTRATCDLWEMKCDTTKGLLAAEREDQDKKERLLKKPFALQDSLGF